MSTHDSGVNCVVCLGDVVAEVEYKSFSAPDWIGKSTSELAVTSFHCADCQVVYRHPTGKPDSAREILEAIRQEAERPEREQREKVMEEITAHVAKKIADPELR